MESSSAGQQYISSVLGQGSPAFSSEGQRVRVLSSAGPLSLGTHSALLL